MTTVPHPAAPCRAPTDARVALAPLPASVGQARRFVREALAQWGRDELVDTAVLLVSELVTNAVLHARSEVTVTVSPRADRVRVEVGDTGAGTPFLRRPSEAATTGRGLGLVQSCALAWGVQPQPLGKAVWFELAA